MKKILVLGAGLVSKPLVDYLLKEADKLGKLDKPFWIDEMDMTKRGEIIKEVK